MKMTITARYPGKCTKCGGTIAAGEKIKWDRATRKTEHVECPAQTTISEPPAPVEVTADAKAKAEKIIAIGGNRWQKGSADRVYIPADLIKEAYGITVTNHGYTMVDGETLSRSNASALHRQFEEGKVWYDLPSGKWMSRDIKDEWAEKVFDRLDEMAEAGPQEEPEATEETASEATAETTSTGPAPVEMAQGMTQPKIYRTNRRAGRCRHCGGLVPAGQGHTFYVDPDEAYEDSGWVVEHKTRAQCEKHHATKTIYG